MNSVEALVGRMTFRTVGRIIAAAAVIIAVGLLANHGLALRAPGQSPSEYVIAQGVALPPSGEAVWRVAEVALGEERSDDIMRGAPGFVVAQGSAVLVVDQVTGQRVLLNGEEAAFAAGHAVTAEGWCCGTGNMVTTITLATGDEPATDNARYVSPSFDSGGGPYDLDLVTGHLEAGESTLIGPVGGTHLPVLILVQEGTVVVSEDGDELATINGGSAVSIPISDLIRPDAIGDYPRLEISASGGGARFVAAVIGWQVSGG